MRLGFRQTRATISRSDDGSAIHPTAGGTYQTPNQVRARRVAENRPPLGFFLSKGKTLADMNRVQKDRLLRCITRRAAFAVALYEMGRKNLSLHEAKVLMGVWRLSFVFGRQEGIRAGYRKQLKSMRSRLQITHDQFVAISWAMSEAERQGRRKECLSLAWFLSAFRNLAPVEDSNAEGL